MKPLFALLALVTALTARSQTIRLDGTVTDDKKAPLEMANVMAINQATKAMDAYAITNDKGRFYLNLKPNTAYTVKLSFLGFKPKELTINTGSSDMRQEIVMEEGGIELEGVEIVNEMPVSISGDTIVYNADSFKTGTERKLEDVLKKLPGVQVNADGEVEVEGKKVSKLMVEGKDFFDGDTKLGVKNIPADAVDKVQVLRNYNEISQLKPVENNEESVAMNIKLKDGKKNFWFGDMTAGSGVGHKESRYIVNPKVFYYNPEYSVNLITNFNNIGELPLTMQDYFKFTGGFRAMMRKSNSNFNVSSNDIGLLTLRNNRAKEIETRFGAANASWSPSKAWTLSGFGIFSSSTNEVETASRSTVLQTNTTQETTEKALQETRLAMAKLSANYKPSANFQFDYDALIKGSDQGEVTDLFQTTRLADGTSSGQQILTDKQQKPFSINQNLSAYWTKSERHIFAFEFQHLYQEEDPLYTANLGNNPFPTGNLGIVDEASGRYDLNQYRFVKTHKADAKVDYYFVATPKSNINVTIGNTYSRQSFDSRFYQVLDNGSQTATPSTALNDVDYRYEDVFAAFHYKILTGKFTFNPGFSVHYYDMHNIQPTVDFSNSFVRLLPDFYALWQIKKSETLTYNFSISNNFTDVNQLITGLLFNSYRSLSTGNPFLGSSTVQTHSLRYFKFNMFNQENIFGNLSYVKTVDGVKSNSIFDGINQFSRPLNLFYADESLSGNGMYGRSFLRYYKASLSAGLNWNKSNNLFVGQRDTRESFSQNYTVTASTNYRKFPNLEVGYTLTMNYYDQNTFTNESPFVRLDYYFLDAFSFSADYQYNHYHDADNTVDNEYDFLSASLIYQKKDSKWEYKFSATNLLNTTTLNSDSFSQFITSTQQYRVQPRYLIFSMKYNL
ncbi:MULTISPECIES: carboxypeptidase regulatory-like domain-containing protein [unclassified Flavobacterium]|uniref:carboxypeptidase regulatory-like domain-containing protein n=1 Tax=unclassified Flavobacterium TaxID=196869 RepID=UPI001F139FDF|nr:MULTISPECIES: carboxypeptidase regulatory-like domain-containing protein [unclassified Flavobacterium]UMY65901.1 TonB-dependent receptor family protein [Flavobacterium sp. HJ-32-4]